MGILDWKAEAKRIPLRMECLLGRHAGSDIRIDSAKVSSKHASLHWRGDGWELRDLGSRNGTFVNGKRLASGDRVMMNPGAVFSLSRSTTVFELIDASGPCAAARNDSTGEWNFATRGLLALPNDTQPIVTLFKASDGQWTIETVDSTRAAIDGEQIRVGDELYTLEIPAPMLETMPSITSPLIDSIRLRLAVTPDEEDVEATVIVDGQMRRLPPRRYHYLLVTLARAWLADEGVPMSVRGYVDRDYLCKKLEMDVNKLNVEIHRARKQFTDIGIDGAAGLFERRPGTLEVRIGIHDVEVVRL